MTAEYSCLILSLVIGVVSFPKFLFAIVFLAHILSVVDVSPCLFPQVLLTITRDNYVNIQCLRRMVEIQSARP